MKIFEKFKSALESDEMKEYKAAMNDLAEASNYTPHSLFCEFAKMIRDDVNAEDLSAQKAATQQMSDEEM